MGKRQGLFLFWMTTVAWLAASRVTAQPPLQWQPTLESAKRVAAQTNRLVLIHFWADWCQMCRRMEREVLSQPRVARQLMVNYVPVKVNADHFPATARQYGVNALPTAIVITPQGQPLGKLRGWLEPSAYLSHLDRVAASSKPGGVGTYGQIAGGPPRAGPGRTDAPRAALGYPSQPGPVSPRDRFSAPAARSDPGDRATAVGPRDNAQAYAAPGGSPSAIPDARPTVAPQQTQGNPAWGLDGYCPVELTEKAVWALGDRRWGANHRNRTYLFAGPEQQRRFLADPDRYAPVLSGNDVVMAIDQGQTVRGYRKHGVFFANRVYLFTNEANLEEFSKRPDYYAGQALQLARAGRDRFAAPSPPAAARGSTR